VHWLQVEKRSGGRGTRLWVEDLQGLLGLVDIGVVEIHPWNATVDDVEHPDMLVFDLDPGSGVPWEWVVEAAIGFRHVLKEQGYWSWPKLTGGKGVHVVAPTARKFTHDAAHRYCKAVAQELAAADPSRYTLSATAKRAGRLFIDYLRNGRGTTAVGAYSPRARSGIPIAAPTTWREIERGIRPDAFDIHSPPTRRMPRRA
jgi:bifunctional non-homologous end joining protein LigD